MFSCENKGIFCVTVRNQYVYWFKFGFYAHNLNNVVDTKEHLIYGCMYLVEQIQPLSLNYIAEQI